MFDTLVRYDSFARVVRWPARERLLADVEQADVEQADVEQADVEQRVKSAFVKFIMPFCPGGGP